MHFNYALANTTAFYFELGECRTPPTHFSLTRVHAPFLCVCVCAREKVDPISTHVVRWFPYTKLETVYRETGRGGQMCIKTANYNKR